MDPTKALEPLQKLGVTIPPRVLTILEVVVPLAVLVGGALWVWWQKRKKDAAAPPPPVEATNDGELAGPMLAPGQLRKAWLRFLSALPHLYRRSILNFDHFVVLGETSSGKSRFIDAYTDWRRQSKEFLESQAFDPDLQVYLGSAAVVTEVPARVLSDHSSRCRTALKRLWGPLYRKRSPAVIVVVDGARMREETPDAIGDLAERVRGKINVISGLRRKPVEVRIVVTHLDALPGWEPFSAFCRDQKIPLHIPLSLADGKPPPLAQIESWNERLRGHLARALLRASSVEFRQMIAFMRRAPELPASLAKFVTVLFAREALSHKPVCGGLYLAAYPAAEPNPLENPAEAGPGPDPQLKHHIAAAAIMTAALGYLLLAFIRQHALCDWATTALADYRPSMVGTEAEQRRREAISAFAWRATGITVTRPDFFKGARERVRGQMSQRIRDDLLIPNLAAVAKHGALGEKEMRLPWRRSLYYLALIHGDRYDGMHILSPDRLTVWSKMTELPPDLIHDYVNVTDSAWVHPVTFDLPDPKLDEHDGVQYWVSFMRELDEVLAGEVITPERLKSLQSEAATVAESLDRFKNDDITRSIVNNLDSAASLGPPRREPVQLELAYRWKFEDIVSSVAASDLFSQRDDAHAIMRALRDVKIDVPKVTHVSELADKLAVLYDIPVDANAKTIVLKVAGEDLKFDTGAWLRLIRDSTAAELVLEFMRPSAKDESIFFEHDATEDFRAVTWNPTNNGSAIFTGRAAIEGRFTHSGYEKLVHDPVVHLGAVLDKAKLSQKLNHDLKSFVKDQIRRYASQYKADVSRLFHAFGVSTPSQEALRVALSLMSADVSPFTHFVNSIDKQVDIPLDSPMLDPLRSELEEFASWHRLVDATAGAPEVGKYKAILAQMLADLGPPAEGAAPAAAPAPAAVTENLETALSPVGRLALVDLRGDKGSYASLVHKWIASVQLPPHLQGPFLAPIEQLAHLGARDIEHVVRRVWEREVLPDLTHLTEKFPFDPTATAEATPNDVDPVLNPQSGRVFDLFRRYFEPISEMPEGGAFRERAALRGRIAVPPQLYALVNASAALASRLYDSSGHPSALSLKISTLPFERSIEQRSALSLVFLSIGDITVHNFNQKPGMTMVKFDWTREQTSQVGTQLTDLDTQEAVFPEPIGVPASHWSLLRLLTLAQASRVKGGTAFTWDLLRRADSKTKTQVRFVFADNPLDIFTLGRLIKPAPASGVGTN